MNCIFIYNPVSGRGKIKKKLDYIEKSLKEKSPKESKSPKAKKIKKAKGDSND